MNPINYWSGVFPFQHVWVWAPLVVWSLIWKGWALWRAARAGSKPWFVALLIVNTAGILEILYIYIFSKRKLLKSERVPVE